MDPYRDGTANSIQNNCSLKAISRFRKNIFVIKPLEEKYVWPPYIVIRKEISSQIKFCNQFDDVYIKCPKFDLKIIEYGGIVF